MADETTQTGEETSWWDLDVFADSELPSTSFDEPLEWPETLDWGEFSAADGDLQFPDTGDLDSDPIFPPADPQQPGPGDSSSEAPAFDTQWQAPGEDGDVTMPHVTVLSGLGGGATAGPAPVAEAADQPMQERLPDSLWAEGNGAGDGLSRVVTTTIAAPTTYSEPDGGGGWRRRFDIRHGNAAVIALISFVSLILLGMFMSVRARNQVPDTSQTRTTSDQIQVQGTLNTVPLTTTVTTTPPAINIADLVPPPEDTTTVTAGGGPAGPAGSGGSAPEPAATPRAAGGGGTGTTQPAAQPTNTTAAPQTTAPPETTTPATSPPVDQPTTPTSQRRTTPTFPSLTSTVPDNDGRSIPSIPTIPGFPAFPNN